MNSIQHINTIGVSLVFAAGLLSAGCETTMTQPVRESTLIRNLSSTAAGRLNNARIFFAHQSVGDNIVDGVRAAVPENVGLRLNVVSPDAVPQGDAPFFAHARLGTNGNPRSKTDAFAAELQQGLGGKLDVAFQKYCFVDVTEGSDVRQQFAYYRDSIGRLQREFPRVTFVHVTVPLTIVQSGPKALIKRWIGRPPDHYLDNIQRMRFNELMRAEYEGKAPIFDLAALESTRPDGSRESFAYNGATSYSLVPAYTDDGSHLSEQARKRAGLDLLTFLAGVLDRRGN